MIERTYDILGIHKFVTQPHVWRHAADDTCPRPSLYFPKIDDRNIWLSVDGNRALFYLVDLGDRTWEVHVSLAKDAYGNAVRFSRRAMSWFEQNICKGATFIANVERTHYAIVRVLKAMGFEYLGPWCIPITRNGQQIARDSYIYREQ